MLIVILCQADHFENARRQRERDEQFMNYLQVYDNDVILTTEAFTCQICFDDIDAGDGIILRECLHQFCRCDQKDICLKF